MSSLSRHRTRHGQDDDADNQGEPRETVVPRAGDDTGVLSVRQGEDAQEGSFIEYLKLRSPREDYGSFQLNLVQRVRASSKRCDCSSSAVDWQTSLSSAPPVGSDAGRRYENQP